LGREGLTARQKLSLALIRRSSQKDYAELAYIVATDKLLRLILEISEIDEFYPGEETIRENILKIKEETIEKANEIIVKYALKKGYEKLDVVRGDTFVCETNIGFPLDNKLLYNCGKVMLRLGNRLGIKGFRQYGYLTQELKKISLTISKIRNSRQKNKEENIKKQYNEMLTRVDEIILKIEAMENFNKIQEALTKKNDSKIKISKNHKLLFRIYDIANKVVDITERRVFQNKTIPNAEKIPSIYETHTQLINRGKFPIPFELGHSAYICQGKSKLIIDYKILEKGELENTMIKSALQRVIKRYNLKKMKVGSFDKAYYSANCYSSLKEILDLVVIGKKGYKTEEDRKRESSPDFIKYRRWRSGVESSISSLKRGNGLFCCAEKGYENYKKYVGFSIVARNLQTLGEIIITEETKKNNEADYKMSA